MEIIRVQQELQPLVPRDVVRWARSDPISSHAPVPGDVPADGVEELKESRSVPLAGMPGLCPACRGRWLFSKLPRAPGHLGGNQRPGRAAGGFAENRLKPQSAPLLRNRSEKNSRAMSRWARLKNARPADIQELAPGCNRSKSGCSANGRRMK